MLVSEFSLRPAFRRNPGLPA